jgi:hypothetical protein
MQTRTWDYHLHLSADQYTTHVEKIVTSHAGFTGDTSWNNHNIGSSQGFCEAFVGTRRPACCTGKAADDFGLGGDLRINK